MRDVVGTPAAFALAFQLAPGLGTVVRLPGATLAGLSRVLAGPLGRTSIWPGRVRALAGITTPRPGQRGILRPVVVVPLGGPLRATWTGGTLHLREGR
ncbi:hypothetical protein [uncultured Deinococcus sp.]|uniref:Uncharacterized protein n=1 Tax=Deinococcus rufus TaxID=2136097 RepID=A0ABV7ZEV0_9DEIO|nr:hypothetical protein [uncultured Deinococcus sp.]